LLLDLQYLTLRYSKPGSPHSGLFVWAQLYPRHRVDEFPVILKFGSPHQ